MKHAKGFTLIEVIMALFILAIVLGSSMRLFNSAIKSEQMVRDKTLANWVAQNHAVQLQMGTGDALAGVNTSEVNMGGSTWLIQESTASTSDSNFRKTEIRVYKEKIQTDYVTQLFVYRAKGVAW